MKWNETNYPRIGETVLRTTLPNGLTVAVVPKPLYRKRYAFFTTRYGGMDMRFRLDGVWHDTPAGIAHYLEHKMFDTEDGNALQELSQNGAEPNAFTSNATTAYYFDCTEHFEENLKILLSFVSVPYFTQESVDKERGIIGQEIRMVEDTPDWRVYTNLLECLYHSSPARVAIAGTVESIAEITPETLYACHKAFYDPANMMLCVVGDVKPTRSPPSRRRSCRIAAARSSSATTGRRICASSRSAAARRWRSRCRSSSLASSALPQRTARR